MKETIRLTELTEENWMGFASLSVKDDQKNFLAPATGIIARGYIYRDCGGRVWGITADDIPVGLALVRDMNDEPRCYDIQQFMIAGEFQGRGFGKAALGLILERLRAEGRFDCAEVCVKMADKPAIALYEKLGFEDTGYIDPDVPDSLNLMHYFKK